MCARHKCFLYIFYVGIYIILVTSVQRIVIHPKNGLTMLVFGAQIELNILTTLIHYLAYAVAL